MRVLVFSLLALVAAAMPAHAQSGGAYSLRWNTLAAGGATFATGGDYRLGGSTGQPDAGVLAAGGYRLQGGAWTPGGVRTTDASPPAGGAPSGFTAFAPAPNPSRADVRFAFDLPAARSVRLTLHDLGGRLVRTLFDGERAAGRHAAMWDGVARDGRRVPAGIYFARLVAGEHTATHRFVRLD